MTRCYTQKQSGFRLAGLRRTIIPATSVRFRKFRKDVIYFMDVDDPDVVMVDLTVGGLPPTDCAVKPSPTVYMSIDGDQHEFKLGSSVNSNDSSLIKTPSSFFLGAIAPTVLHHNVINNDEIDWTHVSTDKSDILDLFGELEDQVINHANDFPSRPLEAPVEDQDSSDHIMASPEEDVSRHAECDQSISPGPCAFALQPVALFAPVHPPSLEIFELPLHPVNVEKSSDEMSICQGALSLDDAQSPEFPTDSLLVMSAKAWASRVLGAPSRVIEQILNKPLSIVAESTGSLFGDSLMYPTTQGDATTEAQCNMQIESTLAQPQTASDSDPFVIGSSTPDAVTTVGFPTPSLGTFSETDSCEAQLGDDTLGHLLGHTELSFSSVRHIVSSTPSRVGGVIACMDARTIVPPFPIATTESLTDLHIAEENGSGVPSPLVSNLDRDSCDSFESMDVSSRDMGQSNSPMFNSLCAFFRTMNTSDEDGFPLGFYNDASPSTTPSGAVSSRITGNSDSDMADCEHDGFAYHSEEATMQADDSLESTEWASGESDSDALMAEIRINPSDSMSDAQYDGDSESSHDVFFIADASIGSLSVIAIEEEGEAQQDVNVDDEDNDDDEDEKFVEHEPTPWFGTNTPTPIPSFRQCLAPVFLRLLSTRVSVVGQSVVRPDSLWSPSSSSSSTSTPVPLASSVGLHSSLRFPVPGASLWSPSARLFSSPFPFPKLLQDDID